MHYESWTTPPIVSYIFMNTWVSETAFCSWISHEIFQKSSRSVLSALHCCTLASQSDIQYSVRLTGQVKRNLGKSCRWWKCIVAVNVYCCFFVYLSWPREWRRWNSGIAKEKEKNILDEHNILNGFTFRARLTLILQAKYIIRIL